MFKEMDKAAKRNAVPLLYFVFVRYVMSFKGICLLQLVYFKKNRTNDQKINKRENWKETAQDDSMDVYT